MCIRDSTKLAPAADMANTWEEIPRAEDAKLNLPGRTILAKYIKPLGGFTDPLIVGSFQWQDLVDLYDAAKQANSIAPAALIKALDNLAPQYQKDPLNLTAQVMKFSLAVHENVAGQPSDYQIVRTGPITSAGVIGPPVH